MRPSFRPGQRVTAHDQLGTQSVWLVIKQVIRNGDIRVLCSPITYHWSRQWWFFDFELQPEHAAPPMQSPPKLQKRAAAEPLAFADSLFGGLQ